MFIFHYNEELINEDIVYYSKLMLFSKAILNNSDEIFIYYPWLV